MNPEDTFYAFTTRWEKVLLSMDKENVKPPDHELYHRLQEVVPREAVRTCVLKSHPRTYAELWVDLGNYFTVIEGLAEGDEVLKKGGPAGGGGGAPGGAGGGGGGGKGEGHCGYI